MSAALQSAFSVEPLNSGIVISVLTLVIIFGGVHRIVLLSVVSLFLSWLSVVLGWLCWLYWLIIDKSFQQLFRNTVGNAFGWHQAVGGGIGTALMQGIKGNFSAMRLVWDLPLMLRQRLM